MKGKKKKKKKKKSKNKSSAVSRRTFAATSMVAAMPALVGCQDSENETASASPDSSPEIGRMGMSRSSSDAAGDWKPGTTIPAEYYIEPEHFANDQRYLTEHFMAGG